MLNEHHLAALDRYENEKIKPGMRVFVSIKASVVQFWEATGSLTLADRTWCCSPASSRLDMLCVQRWYSALLSCNELLFELLLFFYHLKPLCPFSEYSHQQGFFNPTTATHWLFSLFVVKIPSSPFCLDHSNMPQCTELISN